MVVTCIERGMLGPCLHGMECINSVVGGRHEQLNFWAILAMPRPCGFVLIKPNLGVLDLTNLGYPEPAVRIQFAVHVVVFRIEVAIM